MVLKLNEEFLKMTVNLNGIILKKAEIEKNFNVYSRVFEKMYETESTEEDFLSVLGEIGG
jgi:3-dehydroquinate synthetase